MATSEELEAMPVCAIVVRQILVYEERGRARWCIQVKTSEGQSRL
jgi:hypothetical protein